MKITICDVCHYREGKLTEATRYARIKGAGFRVELCEEHKGEFSGLDSQQFAAKYLLLVEQAAG
jgi:hypothetical protein